MNDFYSELKAKNDILEVAYGLGFQGIKMGNYFQGECPNHASVKGKCLTLYPRTQTFYCFHCKLRGDVINLVELFKKVDHVTSVNYLADRAGISRLNQETLTSEEIKQRDADIYEKRLVEGMLTKACKWYHEQLNNYPEIKNYLLKHYGFSQEIIDELMIGFAPSKASSSSDPASYLNNIPEFRGKLSKSGLFNFQSPEGPYYCFFKGRIIFPYWKDGKVIYMAGRATVNTPASKYECYTDKDSNVKKDSKGNPDYIKYKKLLTHNPDDEKKKQISRFIQNNCLLGEDIIRGKEEVIITEGIPDWISAVDKGFAAISPGTTSFREKDWEKLKQCLTSAKIVYIINDNEENQAGWEGALKTGIELTKSGKTVFVTKLPKPEGVNKIDLNEYLRDHSADDLKKIMTDSNCTKSVMDIQIEKLPNDYERALPIIKSDLVPILAEFKELGRLEYYLSKISKKVDCKPKVIQIEVEKARKEKENLLSKKEDKNQVKPIDPEVKKLAEEIAKDTFLFKRRLDDTNKNGLVGERQVASFVYITIDSAKLTKEDILASKISGNFGAGKSYTINHCLPLYPDSAYYEITSASQKSFYHLKKDSLSHKALILVEAAPLQTTDSQDIEIAYIIRTLLSEGSLRYQVTEKDENGKFVVAEKKVEGPTSFLTTTVLENLDPQLDDRLFTVYPNESVEQTRNIIELTAKKKAGEILGLDEETIKAWQLFHETLKPIKVIIPYAGKISSYINSKGAPPIALRRAFNRLMSVIQAIAVVYQHQRKRDDKDRVIAEYCDYAMAMQIVRESFRVSLGQISNKDEIRLQYIKENGPIQYSSLENVWKISIQGISSWVVSRAKKGMIIWCDKNGCEFLNDKDLRKAKSTHAAYIKVNEDYHESNKIGLPTLYELTVDPRWKEDGKLFKEYDLRLGSKDGREEKALNGRCEISITINASLEVFNNPFGMFHVNF
ncbi:MAG: CHC2 zinc finger domain-containing protein [bacterium]